MPVKFEKEVLTCINCGKPRAEHEPDTDKCPLKKKGTYAKEGRYCNGHDKQWKIDNALRSSRMERFVDTPMDLPTVHWKVGDKVSMGNLEDVRVEALADEGRKVVISSAKMRWKDGEPLLTDEANRNYTAVWWFEIFIRTDNAQFFATYHEAPHYSNSSMSELMRWGLEKRYDVNPDYQRGYVWTLQDKVRYIDSVFQGNDLGKFLFVEYKWPRNHREVLDGKQRIDAITEFCSSKFTYKGFYWHEFGRLDRSAFSMRIVQTATLDGDRISKADLLRTFLKVNAAGVPQSDEHLAHVKKLLAAEEKRGAENERKEHS